MALSWTQDRLGPLCRYSEDCAVVMSVIARPDNRDMSVSEIPFNYNARLDLKKLRVGILEGGFEEQRDATAKKNDENALEKIRSLVGKLVPVKIGESPTDAVGFGVESAVFFEDLIRSGNDKKMTNPGRVSGFRPSMLIPAAEYLQSQRARMMMMMKLAEATAGVEVYLVPVNSGGFGGGGGRGRGAAPATDGAPPTPPPADAAGGGRGRGGANRSVVQRHFSMANSAGYPAVNVPHGFLESGSPTNFTIYGRPFCDGEVLALAKAYQDSAGIHLKKPGLV